MLTDVPWIAMGPQAEASMQISADLVPNIPLSHGNVVLLLKMPASLAISKLQAIEIAHSVSHANLWSANPAAVLRGMEKQLPSCQMVVLKWWPRQVSFWCRPAIICKGYGNSTSCKAQSQAEAPGAQASAVLQGAGHQCRGAGPQWHHGR